MRRLKNLIFKFTIFAFAVVFANLSVDPRHQGYEPGFNDSNEIESLIELVLEMGLDIDQAIPESGTPEGDNSITKVNFFDWFYGHDYYGKQLARPVLRTSIFSIQKDDDITEFIRDIIPPPPKA
ncbi:hypothetical protein [Fulvivirga imtechensis]|nr:hypothetical protein [Fulvivirga imtechensis]